MESNRNLIIYSWNARSMYNKLSELKLLLYSRKPHIVCIQETWHRNSIEPKFINYNLITNHRNNNQGGGTAFLIRSDVTFLEQTVNPYCNGVIEQQYGRKN